MTDPSCVVVIPAYNAEHTIAETLHALQASSALSQILKVILLDDCSTDATLAVARSAWTSATVLEVRSNEKNLGERRTVNQALEQLDPSIEWAFILHADDVVKASWIPSYLETMQRLDHNVATICSSYDVWWSDTGQIQPGEDALHDTLRLISGGADAVRDTLDRGCWWHISGCAIRNSAFRSIGPFEPDMPQLGDWEWLLRCLSKGFDVAYVPRSTMRYRQHANSISSRSFREGRDLRERMRILEAMRDQGFINSPSFRDLLRGTFLQTSRRLLVRFIRRDWFGFKAHLKVLRSVGMKLFSS